MMSSRSRCTGDSTSAAMAWAMPSTPFKGVRISWLMVARKVLLVRLDSSAASRSRRAASALRRSLMSERKPLA